MTQWEEDDRIEACLRAGWHRYDDWMLALLRAGAAIEAAEARAVALDDQRGEVKRRWADCPTRAQDPVL